MGTNYYLREPPTDTSSMVCPHCGRGGPSPELHIGKSSAGWCFSLHVHPDRGLADLAQWEELWSRPGMAIKDEYGRAISPEMMSAVIRERTWPGKNRAATDAYSMEGPNNLRRSVLGDGCVGHGAGTWDLFEGDFS
jgi:hypothetical protein